jgi:hypothetical protein
VKPISPVLPSHPDIREVVFAKDQPEYLPLPAVRIPGPDGTVITRWRLSWRERLTVLFRGNLFLSLLTFNKPLQPVMIEVDEPPYAIVGAECDAGDVRR